MRLKKLAAAVLSLTLMCGAVPFSNVYMNDSAIFAEEEYTEGTYGALTYKNYGDYIEISDCDESATEVEIPSEIDGVPVTSIGKGAFSDCWELTSITIPDNITNIGYSAFSNCNSLTTITIPASVTNIESGVFSYCDELVSILVDVENCNYTSVNGILFSYDMTTLIQYPTGKTNKTYSILNIVTSVEDYAFSGCNSLTSVTLSESVTNIGDEAFRSCDALSSITIPDTVTDIGGYAFEGTSWLNAKREENPLVVVNGILIDGHTCEGNITIPDTVTRIGELAFWLTEGLTSVTLPDSVISIGEGAFVGCDELSSITIPYNVTNIENAAFMSCSALTSITIENPECKICDTSIVFSGNTATIYGYENSTAQAYAEKYNRNFVSLGEYVEIETLLGDTDNDGVINSSDASNVLAAYAKIATGGQSPFTEAQTKAADVNNDGAVDSSDASSILAYYAYTATGGTESLEKFLA